MPRNYTLSEHQNFLIANAKTQSFLTYELRCLEREQANDATRARIASIKAELVALRAELTARQKEQNSDAQTMLVEQKVRLARIQANGDLSLITEDSASIRRALSARLNPASTQVFSYWSGAERNTVIGRVVAVEEQETPFRFTIRAIDETD